MFTLLEEARQKKPDTRKRRVQKLQAPGRGIERTDPGVGNGQGRVCGNAAFLVLFKSLQSESLNNFE